MMTVKTVVYLANIADCAEMKFVHECLGPTGHSLFKKIKCKFLSTATSYYNYM